MIWLTHSFKLLTQLLFHVLYQTRRSGHQTMNTDNEQLALKEPGGFCFLFKCIELLCVLETSFLPLFWQPVEKNSTDISRMCEISYAWIFFCSLEFCLYVFKMSRIFSHDVCINKMAIQILNLQVSFIKGINNCDNPCLLGSSFFSHRSLT